MTSQASRFKVRSIREGETELFLNQMCDAFGLDIAIARPIFYNDPFFDLSHKRILIETQSGRIISSLTIVPSAVRVPGGGAIKVAGIAGVCTTPEYRRKGFAKQLLRATIQSAPSDFGYSAAALSTDNPEIYRGVGFETCSNVVHWTAHRKLLPSFPEAETAVQINLHDAPEQLKEIQDLYDHSHSSKPGIFIRNSVRWISIEQSGQASQAIIWRNRGRLEGCLIYREKTSRRDRILEVLDLIASTTAARRGLIGSLRKMESIDLICGQGRPSGLRNLGLEDTPRFTSFKRQGVMLAILDFDMCLSIIASTGVMTPVVRRSESGLTIRLENCVSKQDRKPLRLFSVSTERLGVAIGLAPADEMSGDWISVDVGAMAQLLFGYRSASDLRSQDRLWISSESALAIADSLFPSYDTILSPLDAF